MKSSYQGEFNFTKYLENVVDAETILYTGKVKAVKGIVDIKEFPLLMHIDEIITDKKEVNIPWESFTFER